MKKWVEKGGIIETNSTELFEDQDDAEKRMYTDLASKLQPTETDLRPQNITPQDTPVIQQAAVQKTETENKA